MKALPSGLQREGAAPVGINHVDDELGVLPHSYCALPMRRAAADVAWVHVARAPW